MVVVTAIIIILLSRLIDIQISHFLLDCSGLFGFDQHRSNICKGFDNFRVLRVGIRHEMRVSVVIQQSESLFPRGNGKNSEVLYRV